MWVLTVAMVALVELVGLRQSPALQVALVASVVLAVLRLQV